MKITCSSGGIISIYVSMDGHSHREKEYAILSSFSHAYLCYDHGQCGTLDGALSISECCS